MDMKAVGKSITLENEMPAVLKSGMRPIHTYSIVARDSVTGEMGVAVQSYYLAVGYAVPWVEAGVGAVATQANADIAYGPLGLAAMRVGRSAPDTLRGLLAGDEGREKRQVAMIDAQGRIAAHTGSRCIPPAGHIVDEAAQFSVQANLMANDRVWPAMAETYRTATGDLADRLVAALEAAEATGGDIRGSMSSALVVVRGQSTGRPWYDRKFDLRVDDHPQPVAELKRLLRLQRAYLHSDASDLALEKKDYATAEAEYRKACEMAPGLVEISFWWAVTLVNLGRLDEALRLFEDVFRRDSVWLRLVPILVKTERLPNDPAIIEKILGQAH